MQKNKSVYFCLLGLYFFFQQSLAVAQNSEAKVKPSNAVSVTYQSEDYIDSGSWEFELYLGSFHATSPVNTDNDINLYVLPKIRYYGDRFYFENTTLGFSLIENEKWTFDLISQFNLDAVNFETNNKKKFNFLRFLPAGTLIMVPFETEIPPIKDRKFSYMGGFKAQYEFTPNWFIGIDLTRDISSVHDGKQAHLITGFKESAGPYSIYTEIGFDFKDSKLSDYYYGLHESDIGPVIYQPYKINKWTINPYLTLNIERKINQHFSAYFYLKMQQFDSKITKSILMSEKETYWSFIGVKYRL